jgi:hypothetical protein
MRRFQFSGIIVAEDRGTDLLPRPGDAEKTRPGLLQFHTAPDKARCLRDGWFHIGFANCTQQLCGLR